jgi:capsular exopolysaccharide synthesis family protein
VELQRYLAILRRRWLLIVLTMLAALAAVYATRSTVVTYTGESRIYVGNRNVSDSLSADRDVGLDRVARTFTFMIPAEPIARAAVDLTGVDISPVAVAANTKAVVIQGTNLIRVAYRDTDPGRAQLLATGIADAFVAKVQEFEPGQPGEGDVPVLPAYVFQRAQFPLAPDPTTDGGNYVVAALFGFLLAVGVAALLDHLDLTVKTPEELEHRLGLPVLGVVHLHRPDLPDLGADASGRELEPAGAASTVRRLRRRPSWTSSFEEAQLRDESFRVVRSSLEFATADLPSRTILVTSAASGEGKTSTCSGLAIALANAGRRVVAVDLDLRRPDLNTRLNGHDEFGATDVLLERRTLNECLQFVPTGGTLGQTRQGLYLLASGAPVDNPAELLGTYRTRTLIGALRETADIVLFDTPPVLAVADALVVGKVVAGAVMVVEAGRTTYPEVERAHETLTRSGVKVIGIILNKLSPKSGGYGYANRYLGERAADEVSGNGSSDATEPEPAEPSEPAGMAPADPRSS